jgi:hypothetical protein
MSGKIDLADKINAVGLHGQLTIQLRDLDVELSEREMFVVARGIEHCPTADRDAQVLLIEPRGTANTGDAGGDLTAAELEIEPGAPIV